MARLGSQQHHAAPAQAAPWCAPFRAHAVRRALTLCAGTCDITVKTGEVSAP
jgi:hypothetical protein